MSYTLVQPQPQGLDAGEVMYMLEDGSTYVAVSLVPSWLPNGAGVEFRAKARWVDENGMQNTDGDGNPVCTEYSTSQDAYHVNQYGVPALAKDVLLLLLGEPPELTKEVPVGGVQFPDVGQDTSSVDWTDNTSTPLPVVSLPEDHAAAINIRNMVSAVQAVVDFGDIKDLL